MRLYIRTYCKKKNARSYLPQFTIPCLRCTSRISSLTDQRLSSVQLRLQLQNRKQSLPSESRILSEYFASAFERRNKTSRISEQTGGRGKNMKLPWNLKRITYIPVTETLWNAYWMTQMNELTCLTRNIIIVAGFWELGTNRWISVYAIIITTPSTG
jgi:hypothetical protein